MMFGILSFTLCIRSAPKGEFNSTVKSQNHTASKGKMISEYKIGKEVVLV